MDRRYWSRKIEGLDPDSDYHRIYQILVAHEFPWDFNQALSFALFRTFAVPSIGRLLYQTGEFTERTQKRYDDTGLILDGILEHGIKSTPGRAAVRRLNQMHGSYEISNDDMRYVLATFIVVPVRWLDDFGWRPLTSAERTASTNYYRELGRHMNIKDIPATYDEFAKFMDTYEERNFGYDAGARSVSDATLDLMATFPPNRHAPKALVRRLAMTLMDTPLLEAFNYGSPSRLERAIGRGALRMRGRVIRHMRPRMEPLFAREMANIRSYPGEYEIAQLGTFPRGGCPVMHTNGAASARGHKS
jgi:hypothetical protein